MLKEDSGEQNKKGELVNHKFPRPLFTRPPLVSSPDQRVEFGTQLPYLETKHMIADSLTKGMGANKLPQLRMNLRLLDYHR